jgi:hypothetical protein
MCQNTVAALQQVVDASEGQGVDFQRGLSDEEWLAYKRLWELCCQFQFEQELHWREKRETVEYEEEEDEESY